MAVCPGLTAIGNLEPMGLSGKHDGTIQDAQIGIVKMCFEPSRFDQILRILSPVWALMVLELQPLGRTAQQMCCVSQH